MQYIVVFSAAMDKRIICSPNKLLELFGKFCQEDGCGKEYHFTNTTIGCCLSIVAQCSNGHCRKSWSSDKIPSTKGEIYRDNLDFATAVVLSGNHFTKIQQFCRFFNVAVLSRTSFYAYQRLYICPAIDQYFTEQQVKHSIMLVKSYNVHFRTNCYLNTMIRVWFYVETDVVILPGKVLSTVLTL